MLELPALDERLAHLVRRAVDAEVKRLQAVETTSRELPDAQESLLAKVERLHLRSFRSVLNKRLAGWGALRSYEAFLFAEAMTYHQDGGRNCLPRRNKVRQRELEKEKDARLRQHEAFVCERYGVLPPAIPPSTRRRRVEPPPVDLGDMSGGMAAFIERQLAARKAAFSAAIRATTRSPGGNADEPQEPTP